MHSYPFPVAGVPVGAQTNRRRACGACASNSFAYLPDTVGHFAEKLFFLLFGIRSGRSGAVNSGADLQRRAVARTASRPKTRLPVCPTQEKTREMRGGVSRINNVAGSARRLLLLKFLLVENFGTPNFCPKTPKIFLEFGGSSRRSARTVPQKSAKMPPFISERGRNLF